MGGGLSESWLDGEIASVIVFRTWTPSHVDLQTNW